MDGKNILITGGTGTFGNAFAKYVLENYKPARLVVFSRDEYKQYIMARAFGDHEALRFFIGDVRDEERLNFALKGIDTVFHAAAMKQVVSSEYNPIECIKTNIEGAENLIRASINAGVNRVMAISTDKAVKPINLYGATKACMEKLFIAANHLAGAGGTRFSCARYGNVVGSRGSVVPLFREMRPTGKLTITDTRMSRFWLTIEQGVQFVDNCSQVMRGGEIFVSKTPSMMVTDLAKAMAPECEIEEIGIRPGEKLYEDLIGSEEAARTLEFKKFYVVKPSIKLWNDEESSEYAGETGKPVDRGFSYNSDNNSDWLDTERLTKILSETKVIH
ncbi:MAG: UDP-N-acetylglucosamine 4,6-dehydratase (inverting) [Hoeflea sp.]|uniref:UDP-N-acetylglucosamine 4,6-dehydratase (inverting) n=1 Tax=Hoeflea sp. TaxID=1940281 RepID=UPI003299460F